MQYIGSAVTDIGISKKTNQDSVCVKIANTDKHGQVAMVVLCDGMGGLDKGELASATVIRRFSEWFENELPRVISLYSLKKLSEEWTRIIREQNYKIDQYSRKLSKELSSKQGEEVSVQIGSTITALLIIDNKYMIAHVGDSRAYEISDHIRQLTEDQTYVARELKRGTMTPEEAKVHPWRSKLLQCVGASREVNPEIVFGTVTPNAVYMLCSDGFRHVISNEEIYESFNPSKAVSKSAMEQNSKYLIDVVKSRNERDNITVALLKSFA